MKYFWEEGKVTFLEPLKKEAHTQPHLKPVLPTQRLMAAIKPPPKKKKTS